MTVKDEVPTPPGIQVNNPPPLDGVAVNVALSPAQITLLDKVTVGIGVTTTVPVAVATQPFKSYKTLYFPYDFQTFCTFSYVVF